MITYDIQKYFRFAFQSRVSDYWNWQ